MSNELPPSMSRRPVSAACDWCSEDIPPLSSSSSSSSSSSVTDISGTLRFCGFLCLNKYKMNLFCMEAQQHLPQLQKDMSAQMNYIAADQKLLITPEMWLSDGNSSDHGNYESKKCPKVGRGSNDRPHRATADNSDAASKLHDRDRFEQSRTSPKHSISRRKHKGESNSESGTRNSKDAGHDGHKSIHRIHHHQQQQQQPDARSKVANKQPESTAHAAPGQKESVQIYGSSSALPLFFLPPWLNQPHIPSNLHSLLLNPLLSNPQNQSFFNFSRPPTIPPPQPPSCPLLLPVPVPVPIPIFIPKSFPKTDPKAHPPTTGSRGYKPAHDTPTDGSSPNQAIDFSIHKGTRSTSVPSQDGQPPCESNKPAAHRIKTEPDDHSPTRRAPTPSHSVLETRPSYAERRSLILDAPPPQKSTQSYNCPPAMRRTPNSRKRCYSVHIKTK